MRMLLQVALAAVLTACCGAGAAAEKIPVLLDCDTANEIDDLYAIVRAMVDPSFEIVGLTSAQWRMQPNAPQNTVEPSQRLNERLLALMGRLDIPHPIGANGAMTDAATPQDSPAARFIIQKAKEMPAGRKLTVITTGAMTNIASAIALDPSIAARIRCYSMGLRFEDGQWNAEEFNAQNDPRAVDCLFMAEDLEWHVMTSTISAALRFKKARAVAELQGTGGVYDFIVDYWLKFDPPWQPDMDTDTWTMWDVAAVEAVRRPELAHEKEVPVPARLNSDRRVWVYTQIEAQQMEEVFWNALREHGAR
ncbi:MAG: nucleoside hydrolase [Planctomycetota bacterium]|nr:nucleoside hydrolase [Planctomycetota bacterium]